MQSLKGGGALQGAINQLQNGVQLAKQIKNLTVENAIQIIAYGILAPITTPLLMVELAYASCKSFTNITNENKQDKLNAFRKCEILQVSNTTGLLVFTAGSAASLSLVTSTLLFTVAIAGTILTFTVAEAGIARINEKCKSDTESPKPPAALSHLLPNFPSLPSLPRKCTPEAKTSNCRLAGEHVASALRNGHTVNLHHSLRLQLEQATLQKKETLSATAQTEKKGPLKKVPPAFILRDDRSMNLQQQLEKEVLDAAAQKENAKSVKVDIDLLTGRIHIEEKKEEKKTADLMTLLTRPSSTSHPSTLARLQELQKEAVSQY